MNEGKTLRDVIKEALGGQWNRDLEDQLFWPISYFCTDACDSVRKQTLKEVRKSIGVEDK